MKVTACFSGGRYAVNVDGVVIWSYYTSDEDIPEIIRDMESTYEEIRIVNIDQIEG